MTTAQIIAALATSDAAKREGTPLNIIVYLAQSPVESRTKGDAIRECLAVWKKLGGSEPSL